jgi:hypothetical protein
MANYKQAFKAAAVIAPGIMAALAYFFGDFTPVVKDVCNVLLANPGRPAGVTQTEPDYTAGDAGAPR